MSDLFSSFSRFAKSFPKGSLIFAEFEPGSSFYLIQSGRVQLIKIINGFEKNLDILQPGEIFGEMAILDNSPRSASAIAYDDVMALEFNKENFEILMKGNPAIAMRLLKTFVRRIYAQRRRFMILTIEDRPARIADVFLMLDETQPSLDRTTEMRTFDTTIEEVARWAGLSKEETEDNMHKFIDQGRISVYDDRIIVQNMTDLTRYVNTRRSKEQNLYVL
ncbi:Crp/Fnr family transcriptional regulator [Treponema putidum]|uniref:Crp/Fnr family transcriptional regulator n=1 Tax=Treponema putidum TaxID=221027 RepID=UPI003D93C379